MCALTTFGFVTAVRLVSGVHSHSKLIANCKLTSTTSSLRAANRVRAANLMRAANQFTDLSDRVVDLVAEKDVAESGRRPGRVAIDARSRRFSTGTRR